MDLFQTLEVLKEAVISYLLYPRHLNGATWTENHGYFLLPHSNSRGEENTTVLSLSSFPMMTPLPVSSPCSVSVFSPSSNPTNQSVFLGLEPPGPWSAWKKTAATSLVGAMRRHPLSMSGLRALSVVDTPGSTQWEGALVQHGGRRCRSTAVEPHSEVDAREDGISLESDRVLQWPRIEFYSDHSGDRDRQHGWHPPPVAPQPRSRIPWQLHTRGRQGRPRWTCFLRSATILYSDHFYFRASYHFMIFWLHCSSKVVQLYI